MLYLGTCPNEPSIAEMLNAMRLGLMCQPKSNPPKPGWIWAADNGAFSAKWDEDSWLAWLSKAHPRSGCLFAVVPDVVADHAATLERFMAWRSVVAGLRYPVAFVGQDGAEPNTVPWDLLDALFIGGTTDWKMSPAAFELADEAHRRGKWVHVGRVNSAKRFRQWARPEGELFPRGYADSCDGTFLAFGPRSNLPRLQKWIATDVPSVDVLVAASEASARTNSPEWN